MNISLDKEIKNYTEISKQSEITTSKLYQFFRAFIVDGLKAIDKSQKFLDEYFNELHKESSTTTNNVSFLGFYNDIHRYIDKLKNTYSSMEQNISSKLEHLLKRMQNNHNVALTNLSNLSIVMSDNKFKLDRYKANYISAYKSVIEQEKKIIQLEGNKNIKEEDFSRNNDLLSKYVSNLENQEGIYKSEIKKFNKSIDSVKMYTQK